MPQQSKMHRRSPEDARARGRSMAGLAAGAVEVACAAEVGARCGSCGSCGSCGMAVILVVVLQVVLQVVLTVRGSRMWRSQ
jgi:hypothetical protein